MRGAELRGQSCKKRWKIECHHKNLFGEGGGAGSLRVKYIQVHTVYTLYTVYTVYTVYTQQHMYSIADVSSRNPQNFHRPKIIFLAPKFARTKQRRIGIYYSTSRRRREQQTKDQGLIGEVGEMQNQPPIKLPKILYVY